MKPMSPLTRRAFMRRAAVACAAPVVVPARVLGAEGARPPSERVGVASIGVRNMGGNHLRGLVRNQDARVVALCDVDYNVLEAAGQTAEQAYAEEARTGRFTGCFQTRDFREILDRRDVDAVVVATPDHWHAPIVIAACEAGKDVYSEKPLSLTIGQGKKMVEAVRRHGRVFQSGTQRRSAAGVRHVCELVRNGRIGKVERITAGVGGWNRDCGPTWEPEPVPPELDYDMWLGPAPWAPYHSLRCHYSFRFILDYSGGQVTNNGAHWTDLAQWALGMDGSGPVEVEGTAVWPDTGLFTVPKEVNMTATYANGARLHLTNDAGVPRFYGTDGWVDIDSRADPPGILDSVIRPDEVRLYRSEGSHMDNFLECVRTRREPAAPVEVGHRAATVCHLCVIAMRLGRKVRWDPAAERFIDDPEADRLMDRAMRSPWGI
ncbi:MAG: Gfo/Idh/MocA family oxidoreductase [Planctomycetes bacterium]|nr:Gfo/Idh/MocA family oxidoreductase [Planctomycetota bacterium]